MSQHLHRHAFIDYLRAIAIVLMVIYHFLFDLHTFNLVEFETFNGLFVTAIGRTCLALFMFCVGYSLALNHAQKILWPSFWRRWIKLAGAATLVSVATFIGFGSNWIYFGILHCIALSSILALPFLRQPTLCLLIGASFLIAYAGFDINFTLFTSENSSLDYIPLYPWTWSLWLGISAYHWRLSEHIQPQRQAWTETLSRHSLLIYLIHQPILMSLAYLIHISLR